MQPCLRRFPAILALLVTLAVAGPGTAAAVVGHEVTFAAASPHPYTAGGPAWSVTIEHPGATYIAVHFERFELAPGHRVVVRSPDGGARHTFTGRGKGGLGAFWATHVKGDAAVVELHAPTSAPAWGIRIDRYAAGDAEGMAQDAESIETVCGADDRQNAICYAGSEPGAYQHARAVARLLINGVDLCTGFLVGCQGHLLTNRHCIQSQFDATNTDYEFDAEAPNCLFSNCSLCFPGTIWGGTATLVQESQALDYALIHLAGDPQETFGTLVPDDREAVPGERIYIPQHPDGRGREIALDSTDPMDPSGVCEVSSINVSPCQPLLGETVPNVGYFCDTEGGSSGSPVITHADHRLIALHHCGACANRAIPITAVLEDLGALLPSCEPPEVSPPTAPIPFRMEIDAAGTVEFELIPDADAAYHLYSADTVAEMLAGDWTHKYCDLEQNAFGTWSSAGGAARWTPFNPAVLLPGYWVVVAETPLVGLEGSYGTGSGGAPRPADSDGTGSGFNLGCPAPEKNAPPAVGPAGSAAVPRR